MASNVRISDFSDREILGMMGDLGNGVVAASELTFRVFGLNSESDPDQVKYGNRCVTARLSWMRRFGLVEKGEEPGIWSISKEGEILRAGRLAASILSGIQRSGDDSALTLAHAVGQRFLRTTPVARIAMRREWQFHLKQ